MRLWLARLFLPRSYLLLQRDNFTAAWTVLVEIEQYLLDGGFGHHARPRVGRWLTLIHKSLTEFR